MSLLNCTPYTIYSSNIIASENYYIFDCEGNKYVDMESGVWCSILGHNNKEINDVIKKQMSEISHTGFRYTNSVVIEAAQELSGLLDFNDGKCLFLSSGSEAMEFGVQAAKVLAKKPLILSMEDYFLSAYGMCKNKEQWIQLSIADIDETNTNRAIDSIPFEDVGVFVFEPGNASGTVRLPPKDIINKIETRVKSNNAIVVVDEVTTGMGRSGSWFGFEYYNLKPDIVICGKGLGNGYPVSAVIMNNKMAIEFENMNIRYTQSHMNDPLGCAIIKKVIEIIRRDNLIQKSLEMSDMLLEGLSKLKDKYPCIKEIRGRGLMIAVEFQSSISNLEEIHKKMFDLGYILGIHLFRNILRIYPSLTINPSVVESFLIAFESVLINREY